MRAAAHREQLPWIGVAIVAVALVGTSTAIVSHVDDGARPPFVDPDFVPGSEPAPFDDGALHMAGSGSNLPLTRALARAWDGPAPIIHPSIGSVGGVQALLDDAIGVALLARPLLPQERERGLVATPYARIPVVVAVNAEVPVDSITSAELVEIYAGRRTRWSDERPILVLQRQSGDSSHAVVDRLVPGFAEANDDAYREHRFRVIHHHAGMEEALADTPGAIGIHAGVVDTDADIRVLAVDGVRPSPAAVADGSYPFAKELSWVTVGAPTGKAAEFIAFARSDAGAATIAAGGGVP